MNTPDDRYIPALSFRWLTPLYDPLLKWAMREDTFKRYLVAQADIHPGMNVLDLGCGTGTLTILLKQAYPQVEMTGLDGDSQILDIARAKAGKAGVSISWEHGLAHELPYPPATFDRVVTSLVLHHLTRDNKRKAFEQIYRVLKPGGEFHILDFGQPRSVRMRVIASFMRRLEETADSFDGLIPVMLHEAGFSGITEPRQFSTIFGPVSYLRARPSGI